jgi:hypothetical protein
MHDMQMYIIIKYVELSIFSIVIILVRFCLSFL